MYQVLARKWRPQSFDQLVGQQHVARALKNAIESDRVAHAYIFAGVRGIGKTTVARILAKCLNCAEGPTLTPCNACNACREITDGNSLDVLELDAASRRGIDSIRELQEVVSYAPVRDRYRILILDEFHMLTKEAFNALLKTLEEPPPQVIFVLATTEIQKILPTILSRCQVFEFRRIKAAEVSAHLRKLCEAETVEISDPTLDRIARAGEGSVRDSLSVLERVLAFCGTTVSDAEALQVLGVVRTEVLVSLVEALAARDAARMLAVLDELVEEGHDLVHFWGELVSVVRDLLMLRVCPDRTELISRPREESASLARASEGLTREDLLRTFQIVSDLERGLKASAQPRFLFEAALVRLASLGAVRPIEEILASIGGDRPSTPPPARRPTAGGKSPTRSERASRATGQKKKPPESELATAKGSEGAPGSSEFLETLLAAVHEAKPLLGAMLEGAASVTVRGDSLVLAFDPSADALRRRLQDGDAQEIIRRCAAEVSGRSLEIQVATGGAPAAPEPSRATAASSETEPRGEAERPAGRQARPRSSGTAGREGLLEQATSEPGIKKLLLEFGAEVVDIRALEAPRDLVAGKSDAGRTEESS